MKLSEAWLKLLRAVSEMGAKVADPTGDYFELPMQEVAIAEFDVDASIIRLSVPEENINEMRKVFLGGGESAFGHDYASLIAKDDTLKRIADQLIRKPSSRKAVIALGMLPDVEWVPCINTMHFWIRDGQLHLHYFSRGQDLWTKFVPDILAMRELQADLAARLRLTEGPCMIRGVISSAHLYVRDLDKACELLKSVND